MSVEGAIESSSRGLRSIEHTAIGAGAGALLGGIFGGGNGAEIGSTMMPVGCLADASEIANAAVFLGSDQSSYVTGRSEVNRGHQIAGRVVLPEGMTR
jgi:NAD(P)-dependent dehydrogenase (short-subunit alcohol dehydrogenase family)